MTHGQHEGQARSRPITGSAVHDQLGRVVPLLPVQLAQELEPAGDAGLRGHAVEPFVGTAGREVAADFEAELDGVHLQRQLGGQQQRVAVRDETFGHRRVGGVELVLGVDGPGDVLPFLAQEPPLHAGDHVTRAGDGAGPVFRLRKIGRLDLELEVPAHAVVDVEAGDLGDPRLTRPLAEQRKVDLPVPRTRRVGVVGEERGAALGEQWTR